MHTTTWQKDCQYFGESGDFGKDGNFGKILSLRALLDITLTTDTNEV